MNQSSLDSSHMYPKMREREWKKLVNIDVEIGADFTIAIGFTRLAYKLDDKLNNISRQNRISSCLATLSEQRTKKNNKYNCGKRWNLAEKKKQSGCI